VPATPEESTCVVETGRPKLSAAPIVPMATISAAVGCIRFDDQGRRRDYADIPKVVTDLVDDPFRSLAGELRLAGG
jgi:hypothetical protein